MNSKGVNQQNDSPLFEVFFIVWFAIYILPHEHFLLTVPKDHSCF